MRRAAVAISLSSSGEWTWARSVMGISKPRSIDGGRDLQQAHRGTGQRHEDQHRRGNGHGQRLGAAQRQRLGHQFADHHVEIGDEGKAQRDGGDVRINLRDGPGVAAERSSQPSKNGGGQRFADPAQSQRAQGDAKLHGGQKVVEAALQAADGARSGHAARRASARCAFRGWRPGRTRRPQKRRWPG